MELLWIVLRMLAFMGLGFAVGKAIEYFRG